MNNRSCNLCIELWDFIELELKRIFTEKWFTLARSLSVHGHGQENHAIIFVRSKCTCSRRLKRITSCYSYQKQVKLTEKLAFQRTPVHSHFAGHSSIVFQPLRRITMLSLCSHTMLNRVSLLFMFILHVAFFIRSLHTIALCVFSHHPSPCTIHFRIKGSLHVDASLHNDRTSPVCAHNLRVLTHCPVAEPVHRSPTVSNVGITTGPTHSRLLNVETLKPGNDPSKRYVTRK